MPIRLGGLLALLAILTLPGCVIIDRMSGVAEARDLNTHGIPAQARILKLWDTGITVNNDPVVGLQVEVTPADRAPYIATIERALISRLDVPRVQPRSVIPVRFDPNNPARVVIDLYEHR